MVLSDHFFCIGKVAEIWERGKLTDGDYKFFVPICLLTLSRWKNIQMHLSLELKWQLSQISFQIYNIISVKRHTYISLNKLIFLKEWIGQENWIKEIFFINLFKFYSINLCFFFVEQHEACVYTHCMQRNKIRHWKYENVHSRALCNFT